MSNADAARAMTPLETYERVIEIYSQRPSPVVESFLPLWIEQAAKKRREKK